MSTPIFVAANRLEIMWAEFLAWLDAFFNPELEGYVNFDFGGSTLVNLRVIIFGIFIGVLVASVYMVYIKSAIGPFVRKLLAEECLSEENAKTLEELGYAKNFFVRMALRGSILRSTVIHVPCEEEDEGGNKRTLVRYYIPEPKRYVAEMRFRNRGSGVPTLLFVLIIGTICIFLIFGFLPQILRLVDNTISIFSVEGNTLK